MPGKQKVIQEIQVIRRATYNERHEKIIELIDWTQKYKETTAADNIKNNQQNEEEE